MAVVTEVAEVVVKAAAKEVLLDVVEMEGVGTVEVVGVGRVVAEKVEEVVVATGAEAMEVEVGE